MPEGALSKMRAMECDGVNGVVVRGAKYPAAGQLVLRMRPRFSSQLNIRSNRVNGEGQGGSALEQEPGSVTEESVLESALEWAQVE
jgi:hypothetical protein